MTEKGRKYLSDILLAIELIEEFMGGIGSYGEYRKDAKTKSAVERQLGIIGEAVNQFRRAETNFELSHARQVVTFRNRLIHAYDSVDDSIVWAIVKNHLSILKTEAELGLTK
ncbi:DUF86 domain-containing protein [Persicitalea sp.]|uniref:HepT-like ribonuclease domain-containing protein n=1 Tax=Persicitalea sp. TaxID=3100273 RepID=UPI0035947199